MSTDETTATDAPAADTVPAPPPAPPTKDGVAADGPEPSPTSAAATVTSGDANPAAAANDGEDGFGAEAQPPTAGPAGPWAVTDANADAAGAAAPTYATYSSPNPQGNDADDPTKIDLALINALPSAIRYGYQSHGIENVHDQATTVRCILTNHVQCSGSGVIHSRWLNGMHRPTTR